MFTYLLNTASCFTGMNLHESGGLSRRLFKFMAATVEPGLVCFYHKTVEPGWVCRTIDWLNFKAEYAGVGVIPVEFYDRSIDCRWKFNTGKTTIIIVAVVSWRFTPSQPARYIKAIIIIVIIIIILIVIVISISFYFIFYSAILCSRADSLRTCHTRFWTSDYILLNNN